MVRIDRVTTRGGDRGQTSLGDGSRWPKDHPLIVAIGVVDEANCALGMAALEDLGEALAQRVRQVQNDLFDLGADLASPPGGPHEDRIPRITAAYIQRLEAWGEEVAAELEPLSSFVLPGGTAAAARLHVARATVRAAERAVIAAQLTDRDGPMIYLNRLSDLCFQWARHCNDRGRSDVLWRPGGKPSA
jgi:cob(I)alamin adenosyltransferase